MQPEIDLFGLSLKTFGMCFGAGLRRLGGAIVARRLKELGQPRRLGLRDGLRGARSAASSARGCTGSLGNLDERRRRRPRRRSSAAPGLVWYGGALGGAAGVLLWARRRGMFNLELLDLCSPALALGYAIGRIGCQISGDGDYGSADRPAVGDGLSRRRRADDRRRPPDADLRDAGDGAARLGAVARCATRSVPGVAVRLLPRAAPAPSASSSSSCAATTTVVAGLTEAQLASLVMIAARG